MTRTSLAAALLAVAAIAAGGCSATSQDTGGDDSNEPETEGITLYSGRIPAAIGGAIDAYEADADRDVQVRFGDTGDLAATLIEEGDNSPADVYFAQEPGAIGALAERGLLAELPQDILELVPPQYRDPDGRWVGVTGRARVIAYGSQVSRVGASRLAARAHRSEVEGPGRLEPGERLAAAVRDRAAARVRR